MNQSTEHFRVKISAHDPNIARETPTRWWDPSRRLLQSIRAYQSAKGPLAPLSRRVHVLRHRFWSVVTGADIPLNVNIGLGFMMPHPNGIVIHPRAEIGCNCLFFQQVTIAGLVKIGGHVDIGAGAKIIGPLTIGNHVRIGANAVVTADVSSDCTVAGIPARIISH